MKKLLIVTALWFGLTTAASAELGQILYQRYDIGTGTAVADLTGNPAYPDSPTYEEFLSSFSVEPVLDNYGGRIIGWLIPPRTGDYRFWITTDDAGSLRLSPDADAANAVEIASVATYSGVDEWAKEANQRSEVQTLEAGYPYAIYALWKEQGGGDRCRVAWSGPGIPADISAVNGAIIDGRYLSSDLPRYFMWGGVDPAPASGATGVDVADLVLSWTQADVNEPPSAITEWRVFVGEDPAVGEPNALRPDEYLYASVPGGQALEVDASDLKTDATYYWRVDAVAGSTTARGYLWSFQTVEMSPVITEQPQDTYFGPGCQAELNVVGEAREPGLGGEIAYTWYRVVDGGNDVVVHTGQTYTTDVEGQYYVVLSNDADVDTVSNTVQVSLAAKLDLQFAEVAADGDAGQPGAMAINSAAGTVTVTGSGSDIWNPSDEFHYAYKTISGDFSVTARIGEFSGGTNDWRKAGVMVREDLSPIARHAFIAQTAANGLSWQGRPTRQEGDISVNNNDATIAARLVRLTRTGDTFEASYSTDNGATWLAAPGEAKVYAGFPVTALIGFAVTSHDASQQTTVTFSDFGSLGGFWAVAGPFYSPAPEPVNGWIDPDENLTVSWEKAPHGPCGATYDLYFGTDPASLTLYPDTDDSDFEVVISETDLDYEGTYYVRVDTVYQGEVVQGSVWSFDTIKRVPVIVSQPPRLRVVEAGGTVDDVTVGFTSLEILPVTTVRWRRQSDDSVVQEGAPVQTGTVEGVISYTSTLVLNDVGIAEEGYYYAAIINDAAPEGIQSNPTNVLTARRMLYLPFDDEADPLAEPTETEVDVRYAGPDPLLYPVWTADGKVGGAVSILGENDPNAGYIETGMTMTDLGIVGNSPRTVSVWANTRAFNGGGLYDGGAYATGQSFGLRTLDTVDDWRVQYYGGANDRDINVDSIGNWLHFVLVHNGQQSKLYVNGELAVAWNVTLNTATTHTLRLGTYQWNSTLGVPSNIFDGLLDEFELWNYALSTEEVGALYYGVTGEAKCIENPVYDLNGDCVVNFADFAILAGEWLVDPQVYPGSYPLP